MLIKSIKISGVILTKWNGIFFGLLIYFRHAVIFFPSRNVCPSEHKYACFSRWAKRIKKFLFNFLAFGSVPLFGLPSEVRCNSLFQHDSLKRQLSRFKFYCSNLKNKTKQNIELSPLCFSRSHRIFVTCWWSAFTAGNRKIFSLIKPEFAWHFRRFTSWNYLSVCNKTLNSKATRFFKALKIWTTVSSLC